MEILIILCLCLLSTGKVTVQGGFAKKNVKNSLDAIVFNGMVFLAAVILFCKDLFPLKLPVLAFAAVFGFLTVLFQMFYISAMSCGNVSMSVMVVSFCMILPTLVSHFVYGDSLSAFRIAGIALTGLALALSAQRSKGEGGKGGGKWLVLSLSASLCNGAMMVCQKVFSTTQYKGENEAFVAYSYAVAVLVSLVFFFLKKARNKEALSFTFGGKAVLFALGTGLFLGVFQWLYTLAPSIIEGTKLYPAFNGGSLVTSGIAGVLILKDKLSHRQKLSLLVAVVAIVLLNF